MTRVRPTFALGVLAALLAGCETPYYPVRGAVTLDGRPLKGALVGFYPEQGRGSHGMTDAEGRYELKYTNKKSGVPAGRCVVRITTADALNPERLPKRYHEDSELAEEVKAGDNVFDFALKSK